MRAILVALAACAPAQDPVGETLWERPSSFATTGQVGASGHLVLNVVPFLDVIAPTGALVWRTTCDGGCGFDPAIDAEGNVFSATQLASQHTLTRFAAADGAVSWTHRIEAASSRVALADDGAVWWFAGSMLPIDFGGGPVGPSTTGRLFGRFRASDGAYDSSGMLDFFFAGTPYPLADGGFIAVDATSRELVAFDVTGTTRWRYGANVFGFAVHEDGELTYLELVDGRPRGDAAYDIVRIDAARNERWRRHGIGTAESITALADGRAVVAGLDSLAGTGSIDASFLALFDRDGAFRREVRSAESLVVYSSRTRDGFRMFETSDGEIEGTLTGRAAP